MFICLRSFAYKHTYPHTAPLYINIYIMLFYYLLNPQYVVSKLNPPPSSTFNALGLAYQPTNLWEHLNTNKLIYARVNVCKHTFSMHKFWLIVRGRLRRFGISSIFNYPTFHFVHVIRCLRRVFTKRLCVQI